MHTMKEKLEGALDREITCVSCKEPFTFTAGEQAFYQKKGFSDPKRCKPCRDKRREEKEKGSHDQRPLHD